MSALIVGGCGATTVCGDLRCQPLESPGSCPIDCAALDAGSADSGSGDGDGGLGDGGLGDGGGVDAGTRRVVSPTFSLAGATYYGGQSVTLSTTTSDAKIYYTTSGVAPSPSAGLLYTGDPIAVDVSMTLKAVASVPGWLDSPVSSATYDIQPSACTIKGASSSAGTFADHRIRSELNCGIYRTLGAVRTTTAGEAVSVDYMLHKPRSAANALVLLLAGLSGEAEIEGADGVGKPATQAGGDFLVRSAHLFAARGLRTVTIDQPSDRVGLAFDAYDAYRTSVDHAIDLTAVLGAANPEGLPVVLVGTSRGAISAVAQSSLGEAISISSPVTIGSGTPVRESGQVKPSSVASPAQVLWHPMDPCMFSPPSGSQDLVPSFIAGTGLELAGGFAATDSVACSGSSVHGFYGMEVSAVDAIATWIDAVDFADARPRVTSASLSYSIVTNGTGEDIASLASAGAGGALTFSLPFAETALGGTAQITGTLLEYTPPSGLGGLTDRLVFVVAEEGGGVGRGVLSVDLP